MTRTKRRFAGPALTPMIDVVFLLLLFFLLTAQLSPSRAIPLTSAGTGESAEEFFLLEIGQDLQLGGEYVSEAALITRLAEEPTQPLAMRAGEGVPFSEIVRLSAIARGVGINKITLVEDK